MALDLALISIAIATGVEEMFNYMIEEVIRGMGRSLIAVIGRYIVTGKATSLFEKAFCDE